MKEIRAYAREDRGIADTIAKVKQKANQEILNRYIREKQANGGELKPLACKLYTLKKFANIFSKPFDTVTKDDIIELLSQQQYNKVYYKKMLKQFFRWLLNEENPKIISWINIKKTQNELKNQRVKITLTEAQASEILSKADDPMDRAWLELEADNPNRPKDLENLRVKNVHIDENGVILDFISKTESGKRSIFLQNSRAAFLKYWEMHPYKDNPEAPVFYSKAKNSYGKPLLWGGFNGRLRNIIKRTNLTEDVKKNITLYTWRRTVTTWKLQDPDYTASEVQKMGGWSSIRMLDTYGKITDQMVNKKKLVLDAKRRQDKVLIEDLKEQSKSDSMLAKLMSKYGLLKDLEKMDLLGVKKCPRCTSENISDADYCSTCWLPLKKEFINMKENIIDKVVKKKTALSKDIIKETLKEMVASGELVL